METRGYLDAKVYTSAAQIPIQGATVIATRKGPEGRYELLSVQVTDSSGGIRRIPVETPARGESTSPEDGDGPVPYALCQLWAEYPGFARLLVEGIQVFPGVATFQGLDLSPVSAGESGLDETEIQDTAPQDL